MSPEAARQGETVASVSMDQDSTGRQVAQQPSSPIYSQQDGTRELPSNHTTKQFTSPHKHFQTEPSTHLSSNEAQHIADWAATQTWPASYYAKGSTWSAPLNRSLRTCSSASKSTSKCTSKSMSLAKVVLALNKNGVFIDDDLVHFDEQDGQLLRLLERQTRDAVLGPHCPPESFHMVLKQVALRNEARVQRDILPWIVPSPNLLALHGVPGIHILDEEIDRLWTDTMSLGPTKPKPDLTVGLSRAAFTADELAKIDGYTDDNRPSFISEWVSYPFLVCECENAEPGLDKAGAQNLNSAAIAIHALFALYETAYGVDAPQISNDLVGRFLVFSVVHNHKEVELYAHYALQDDAFPSRRKYCRHYISGTKLLEDSGRHVLKPYNFVRNVYEIFAPQHLQRVKTALAQLPQLPA